jgi:hypothetical protein
MYIIAFFIHPCYLLLKPKIDMPDSQKGTLNKEFQIKETIKGGAIQHMRVKGTIQLSPLNSG